MINFKRIEGASFSSERRRIKHRLKDRDLHRLIDEVTDGEFSRQVDEFFLHADTTNPRTQLCTNGNVSRSKAIFDMWSWEFNFIADDFEVVS